MRAMDSGPYFSLMPFIFCAITSRASSQVARFQTGSPRLPVLIIGYLRRSGSYSAPRAALPRRQRTPRPRRLKGFPSTLTTLLFSTLAIRPQFQKQSSQNVAICFISFWPASSAQDWKTFGTVAAAVMPAVAAPVALRNVLREKFIVRLPPLEMYGAWLLVLLPV